MHRLLFPNPMSSAPYDTFRPITIGAITPSALNTFMSTAPRLRKRETSLQEFGRVFKRQMSTTLTTDDLYSTCVLNNVRDPNVPASCLSGVYNKFCRTISTTAQLQECHNQYNLVFSNSIFSELGRICPAWRVGGGPRSGPCTTAINNFYKVVTYGSENVILTRTNALDLVNTIFGSQTYAPCRNVVGTITCTWT